ncbi:eIF-2-alpha kinase GCN2-like [Xenia sp. Carnegie-2017]|uniref:eIF-2-alpha kinase GCN2-like n=1 Tax=Xenia sp. Carnegie-2017 TaxID=2897299 RepID=UPI001F03C9F9|nr:eIF-2-alpha kinase GCN2-like [Xenia sp. Carnegie-2017]
MSHGLSNNITLDKLDAEKDQGRNQNGCDNGDESPDLRPISFSYAARNSIVWNEFEVLQILRKGGFASVRNKLDGCLYAIKRIPLNPKSVLLNRKITREEKLLSRLSHENIVRYYLWIEVEEILENETCNSETKSSMTEEKQRSQVEDSLMKLNVVKAPSVRSSVFDDYSWTNKNTNDSKHVDDDKSSSSSENEDEESDFEIEEEAITTCYLQEDSKFTLQSLYIQIEYCEESTLRNVIDEGL